MLRIYRHRVNTIHDLDRTPDGDGIEFDLRSDGDRVIVTHDPFTDGPNIDEFFARIGGRPCIFNVKSEGIEGRVLHAAKRFGIEDFFFLDCSVPAMVKLSRQGERRIAVRYSELEPAAAVLAWTGKATWCWADCFTKFPGDDNDDGDNDWARVAAAFRVCLVSPELQGHVDEVGARVRAGLGQRRYDAVCTKEPQSWRGT